MPGDRDANLLHCQTRAEKIAQLRQLDKPLYAVVDPFSVPDTTGDRNTSRISLHLSASYTYAFSMLMACKIRYSQSKEGVQATSLKDTCVSLGQSRHHFRSCLDPDQDRDAETSFASPGPSRVILSNDVTFKSKTSEGGHIFMVQSPIASGPYTRLMKNGQC